MSFHIGSYVREMHSPSRKKTKIRQKLPYNIHTQLREKELAFQETFRNVNPIYAANQTHTYLTHIDSKISFAPKQNGEITILLPKKDPNSFVHNAMYNRSKSYFEWFLYFMEMNFNGTNAVYGTIYYDSANDIFSENQTIRWRFKILFSHWLHKKCEKKRIGQEKDVFTHDPIPLKHMLTIQCCRSRCMYSFHGNTLIQLIRSNLEMQINSIPVIMQPQNPYTNMPFSYGQMLQIYNKCVQWCANNNKMLPTTFALYRESNFGTKMFARVHTIYLQFTSIYNYSRNDDMDSDFFFENLGEFFRKHRHCLIVKRSKIVHMNVHSFQIWHTQDPNNCLLKQWKSFVCDFWLYEQIGIFPRETWSSTIHMIQDFNTLYSASVGLLKEAYTKHKAKPVVATVPTGIDIIS